MKFHFVSFLFSFFIIASSLLQAQETSLFWGDTHLHTANSTDAYDRGLSVDIETAYRYARGLPVIQPATGQRIKIDRPLDFLVVADHAEFMGLSSSLAAADEKILATQAGQRLKGLFDENTDAVWAAQIDISLTGGNKDMLRDLNVPALIQDVWEKQIAAAEANNIPGEFTALIGFEWSSTANDTNQHRVVFTADDGEIAVKFRPYSSYDSENPKDLWNWLQSTERGTGARLLAIPHNSNLSKGMMFSNTDAHGNAMSISEAQMRQRWEPVIEVTQYKGTSETSPALSPNDEFAAFELREYLFGGNKAVPYPGSFARTALMRGLQLHSVLGINPYQFGMIGSSDSHTGLVSVNENNFMGKSALDTLPNQRPAQKLGLMSAWEVSASGLAGVWARNNSREEIFNSFMRREVFATSGPRIALRFFAGFDFNTTSLSSSQDIAQEGYAKGIPMGGELIALEKDKVPIFLLEALADPLSASLDRLQIIKGWQDSAGEVYEKIYEVSWSGSRTLDHNGKLPAIINTVDVRTASYDSSTGATRLIAYWQDPDFDPSLKAFYYVRALEIPTPRHHVYDALALGLDPLIENPTKPTWIQERAWSSPIWYNP